MNTNNTSLISLFHCFMALPPYGPIVSFGYFGTWYLRMISMGLKAESQNAKKGIKQPSLLNSLLVL